MTNIYDPFKAAEIAGAQGRAIGYTAGLYSTAGLSNIAAPSAEVLNQNGYSIYQTDDGIKCVQDRDTKNGSVWTSDSLGVTFDYSGDTLSITPTEGAKQNGGNTQNNNGNNINNNYPFFGTNFNNGSNLADNSINNFYQKGQEALNKLEASGKNPNVNYGNLSGLGANETVDAMTGEIIDKEKDASIDKIKNRKTSQYKFAKIADLINKVYAAQNAEKQTVTAGSGAVNILGGTAAGAGVGFLVAGPVGAVVGGIAGLIGGIFTTSSDASDAKTANKQAENNSAAAAQELKDALDELLAEGNEEEFIAFERYYYEVNGGQCDLAEVLADLEVTEDSSKIAQASGIDSEYLMDVYDKIDESNEYLTSEKTEETQGADTPQTNTFNPQTALLEQKTKLYYDAWIASLTSGEATLMGETKKSADWEKLYIDTYNQWQEAANQ